MLPAQPKSNGLTRPRKRHVVDADPRLAQVETGPSPAAQPTIRASPTKGRPARDLPWPLSSGRLLSDLATECSGAPPSPTRPARRSTHASAMCSDRN